MSALRSGEGIHGSGPIAQLQRRRQGDNNHLKGNADLRLGSDCPQRDAGERGYPRQGNSVPQHTVGDKGYPGGQGIHKGSQGGRIAFIAGNERVHQCLPEGGTGVICTFY
ncbi:hypothetical protein D3C87_1945380 [compost metagenome]